MDQTEAFRVLASADRQLLLHELLETDGEAHIEELARQVAARRHRVRPGRIGDERVERAHVRLMHTHLPLLAEADIVDFDPDDDAVSLTDGEDSARLFDAATELDSWPPDDLLVHPFRSD